jgi:hypothetical protein
MAWSIILDLLVSVLLVVTIAYAVVLNRRLVSLRRQRGELEGGTAAFQQAVRSAEDGIARLKVTTEALQKRIDAATALQSDLAFLVERGESAAERLETGVRATRPAAGGRGPTSNVRSMKAGKPEPAPAAASSSAAEERAPRSETERALIRALAGDR